jgi:hypothetical protein
MQKGEKVNFSSRKGKIPFSLFVEKERDYSPS